MRNQICLPFVKMWSIFLLIFCVNFTYGQKDVENILLINQDVASVFDKVVDYCIANDQLIVSLDKDGGFIQSRIFVENKKIITIKDGDRITFSFLVRSDGERSSRIVLQVYQEEKRSSHDTRAYHYKDLGVSKDLALYSSVLDGVKKYLLQSD